MAQKYAAFLQHKTHLGTFDGFDPLWMPDFLYDFQAAMVTWALQKGRAALFEDCGLGKTVQQLVWAMNVFKHTEQPVLLIAPLAVSFQTQREAEAFGIDCTVSKNGKAYPPITITNYERLHLFTSTDFSGVIADESSILKSFNGKRRAEVTDFMRKLRFRLLCTATAAPNDYIELGTSSEALGELGYTDMLTRFFRNNNNTIHPKGHYRRFSAPRMFEKQAWRFKGHAEASFWRWVCSWARALRYPSDLGYADQHFRLPPLIEQTHHTESRTIADGQLFAMPAMGLHEQREERRRTLGERCDTVADLVNHTHEPALVWCHLNDEGNLLSKIIPGGEQIKGGDADDTKEERFAAFIAGDLRVLITKPKIGAWGLNLQHCAHVVLFPTYSYEQYYQGIRRCWRFGQERPVKVDIVMTTGDEEVMAGLQRKTQAANQMFSNLVDSMKDAMVVHRPSSTHTATEVPPWIVS